MWEMMLRVTREALRRLQAEAAAAGDEECCGLLLGMHGIEEVRPALNVAADRRRRFEIDPQALIDAHRAARRGDPAVVGYYHSHPSDPARPSATDRAMATGDGRVWAIIGNDGVTFWRDDGQGFARLSYVVEDR
jgi:proteasome lid subunit RPN8/RPN11